MLAICVEVNPATCVDDIAVMLVVVSCVDLRDRQPGDLRRGQRIDFRRGQLVDDGRGKRADLSGRKRAAICVSAKLGKVGRVETTQLQLS